VRVLILTILAVLSFLAAVVLRPTLYVERRNLGLVRELPEELPAVLREIGSRNAASLAATIGVFRPILINFLWLRSDAMRREGRWFEATALARGITTLQPRLPEVWEFQARSLAYDVSADSPHGDRFRWILDAVELLRDRGCEYNPTSARLYWTLSFLFLNKVGDDIDDAHILYKESLARIFEPPAGVEAQALAVHRSRLLRRWRLDPAFLYVSVVDGDGSSNEELELRSPYSHALYWARIGLALAAKKSERYVRFKLRAGSHIALRELLRRGVVIRQPEGRHYANLPDLRFTSSIHRFLDEELEVYRDDEEMVREIKSVRQQFLEALVVYCTLWNRREAADDNFRELAVPPRLASMETFVADGLATDVPLVDRQTVLDWGAGLVRTSFHLLMVETDATAADFGQAAEGMSRLAGLLLADWSRRNTEELPTLDEVRKALAADTLERLRRAGRDRLAKRLEELLADRLPQGESPSARELGLSSSLRLPPVFDYLHLEALDPLYGDPPDEKEEP